MSNLTPLFLYSYIQVTITLNLSLDKQCSPTLIIIFNKQTNTIMIRRMNILPKMNLQVPALFN
jgi:hypothetical protein